MIITRTEGLTNRSYKSLAAEFAFHNVMYIIPIDSVKESAKDANLEYSEDPRWYVRWPSNYFDRMGWY